MFNTERYRRDAYFNADSNTVETSLAPKNPIIQRAIQRAWLRFALKFLMGCIVLLVVMVGLKIGFTTIEYYAYGSQENAYLLRKITAAFSDAYEKTDQKPIALEIGGTHFGIPAAYIIFNKPHILPNYRSVAMELLWQSGNPVTPHHSLLNLVKWQDDVVWVEATALPDIEQIKQKTRLLLEDMAASPQKTLGEGKTFFASKGNNAFDYVVFYKKGAIPTLFKCEKSLSFLKNPTCTAQVVYKDSLLLTYTITRNSLEQWEKVTQTLQTFFARYEEERKTPETVAIEK